MSHQNHHSHPHHLPPNHHYYYSHPQLPPPYHQNYPSHPYLPPQNHHQNNHTHPDHPPPNHHQIYHSHPHHPPPNHHGISSGGGGVSDIMTGQSSVSSDSLSSQLFSIFPLNGSWRSGKDLSHRRGVLQNIEQIVKERKQNSKEKSMNLLPLMAQQLETSLYRSAPSLEVYTDMRTLPQRLHSLTKELTMHPPPNHHDESRGGEGGGNEVSGQSSVTSDSITSHLSSIIPMNGNWRDDDEDISRRRQMTQKVEQLLEEIEENSYEKWLDKLPQMVQHLEVSLYRSAPSLKAYADMGTLGKRVNDLAVELGGHAQKAEDGDDSRGNKMDTTNEIPTNLQSLPLDSHIGEQCQV